MVQINFDASKHQPRSFEPMKPGTYIAQITKSEMRESKAGNKYLSFRFDVLDGEYKGRVLFENLHLWHTNTVAVEVANSLLAGMCRACGVVKLQNTQQLHHQPMKIKVKIQEAKGDYEASNAITAFEAADSYTPPAQEPFAPETAPQATQTDTPAWAVGGADDEDDDMPF